MYYLIKEQDNLADDRRGYVVKAKSLGAAKRVASRGKTFEHTILLIEEEDGRLVASRENGGEWQNH